MNSHARAACQSRSNGRQGDLELATDFGERQAGKEAQFGNAGLACVELSQLGQRAIEVRHVHLVCRRSRERIAEGDAGPLPRSLAGAAGAGLVDEDAPHHLRGDAKELSVVPPDRKVAQDDLYVSRRGHLWEPWSAAGTRSR